MSDLTKHVERAKQIMRELSIEFYVTEHSDGGVMVSSPPKDGVALDIYDEGGVLLLTRDGKDELHEFDYNEANWLGIGTEIQTFLQTRPPHRQMSTQKNEHNPEIELKPCPFCGGNASYYSRFDVKCGVCGAEINSLNPTETWNRRITPPTGTTGSGREGDTPETVAMFKRLLDFHGSDLADEFFTDVAKLERQRDAALAKNADLLKSENDQLADIEALTSHITTDVDAPETSGSVVEKVEWLLAQLEALRRDGERLDWLETHPFMAYRDRDPADGKIDGHFTLVDEDRGRKHGRRGIVEPTLRAAIDSAQRQEGK